MGLSPGQQAILLLALILIATATFCDCIFAINSCQLEVNLVLIILRSSFSFSSGGTRLLSTLGVISDVRGEQTLIILVNFVVRSAFDDIPLDILHLLCVLSQQAKVHLLLVDHG